MGLVASFNPFCKPIHADLDAALRALEADHEFLLAGGVFSKETLQQWIEFKREAEHL